MPGTAKLIDAALELRGEAPQAWDQFVLAVREYAAATTTEMLRCPPELLMRAQGMAMAATDISTVLLNAPKLKEKMLNGRPEQQPQPEHRRHGF
jgi:hypothetical protein